MNTKSLHTSAKRGLSVLLVLVTLLSFVPMQAFAYGDVPMEPSVEPIPAEVEIMPLSAVPISSWPDLRTTIAAVPDGGAIIIELTNDFSAAGPPNANAINILAGRDITLIGGQTLTQTTTNQRHFTVNGILRLGNVTLSGAYPEGNTLNHGGVTVNAGGSLFMEAGSVITRNRWAAAGQGGGVTITGAGASFTMNGGEISGNVGLNTPAVGDTSGIAGGVFVGNTTTFTMNGGVIRNNIGRFGGGVTLGTAAGVVATTRMYMHGGEIYGNTALFGGAVNVERGTLTMTAGTMHNNSVSARNNNVASILLHTGRGGGGVFLQNGGIFDMSGGTIRNNHAYTHGGGVMVASVDSAFTMTGGTIRDNTAYNTPTNIDPGFINTGGGVRVTNGTFIMGSATLEDGTITSGTISGNTTTNNGGGVQVQNGVFTMSAGAITGNTATNNGGGVWLNTGGLATGARLNMTAGAISDNTATYGNGGGIFTSTHNYANPGISYTNILAANGVFSGNSAGGGKFLHPTETGLPFEALLNNYDINYIGQTQVAIIAFLLNGGYVDGSPASIIETIPLTEALEVPITDRPNYEFLGWVRYGDPDEVLLSAEDIEAMTITGSISFIAQWYPLDPITVTYLSGVAGTFPGGVTSATELLAASGGYLVQVPTPIPDPGFQFIGWIQDDGDTLLYTAELLVLFIDTDTTFTAQWRPSTGGGGGGGTPPPQIFPSRQAYLIGAGGQIRPNANITRAEVATIFFRLINDADRAANWTQTNPYSDVVLENWFNNAVSTTTGMGIFQGRPDGRFAPNQAITRAEFAAAAMRFAEITGFLSVEEDLFNDITGHWANAYINAMAVQNWIQGPYGQGGAFYPDRLITRAETAAIVNRMFGRLPESPADLLPDMKTWPDNANTNAWYYLYLQAASNSYTYERKPDGIHERWLARIPVRNWAVLERPDSTPEDIM